MKWIFYAMVAINLAMFAWISNVPPSDNDDVVQTVAKDVGDLKIVSDVELVVRSDFQKKQQAEIDKKQHKPAQHEKTSVADNVFVENGIKTVCRRLGPFPERKIAVNIADGLAAFRLAPKVIEDKQIEVLGYWAVLPALPTKDEADLVVKMLKSRGIQDVRRFSTGNLINAISLGLFSTEANARRRAKSVEEAGFLAIVQPKEEVRENFWLEFTQPLALELPLDGIMQNYPETQNKPCPGIAQN